MTSLVEQNCSQASLWPHKLFSPLVSNSRQQLENTILSFCIHLQKLVSISHYPVTSLEFNRFVWRYWVDRVQMGSDAGKGVTPMGVGSGTRKAENPDLQTMLMLRQRLLLQSFR